MRIWHALSSRLTSARSVERRRARRNRTRLRPGKLLDPRLAFLADCAILDRSAGGIRVRCFGGIAADEVRVAVFDENDGSIRPGRLIWRSVSEAGIAVDGEPLAVEDDDRRRIAGPYYAVSD